MGFLATPHLPTAKVTALLVSPQYEEILQDLQGYGLTLLLTEPCADLQPSVCLHPDLLCHLLGGNRAVLYPYSYGLSESLTALGFTLIPADTPLRPQYPFDVGLNAARVGDLLFCHPEYTDKTVLSGTTYRQVIPVKQGYTKCSVLIVDERHLITADRGIAAAAQAAGLEVLLCSPGGVRLDGYDYGFIGGATVKLAPDTVYFTGKLSSHRDAAAIRDFLRNCGVQILEGPGDGLIDIGSLLPLLEE